MDILEKIGDTLVNVGRDVTKKAKDVSGIAKLRLDIRSKEDFIKEQYLELGKAYYEAKEAIAEMERQILELKKVKVCPDCGAEASDTAGYCSVCGAKLSVVVEEAPYEEADDSGEEIKLDEEKE